VDPVIVADTDGAGFIPADAPLQANEAGIGFATLNLPIPPIPVGADVTPIGNYVDPTLTLPSNLQIGPNGTVTVPVNLDDAHPAGSTGLIRGHLVLTYNPNLFTVTAADVQPGSVLAGGDWSVVPTIDQARGEIAIALSSDTPISSALGGNLVTIDFHQNPYGDPSVVSGRVPESAAIALVASANPNGQYAATELEDAQGTFTLTPALTNSFDPRIDTMVMLTAAPTAEVVRTTEESLSIPTRIAVESTSAERVEAIGVETSNPPAMTLGLGEPAPESSAGPTTPVEAATVPIGLASAHGASVLPANSLTFASVGLLAGAPMGGVVFQVGGAPSWGTIVAGPRLADHLFQILARGANYPGDASLVNTLKDAFGRGLAGPWLWSSSATDHFNRLDLDEMGSALNWQGLADGLGTRGEWREARQTPTVHQPTSRGALQPTPMERAAVDRYFAQTADDTDQDIEDEGT
jgi:hypothetical protein